MAYTPVRTNKFERDIKRCKKRGKKMEKLASIIRILVSGQPIPAKHRDHALVGNYAERRECHIEPDWLLVYQIDADENRITFERTGSHSDLF
jgi:mRNA interferase YafQ